MKRGKNMLAYAAKVALLFKQKKGQLQNRKQRRILEREQYAKETAVIDTAQAVQVLEKIRPCEKAECKELTFRGGCAVSVIIPVYNAAGTLSKCLDSICGQKLTQGFEVICVNDGSTDGSADILSEYEKRYPNLVVIEEENRGGAGARNCGLQKAEGKYLFFLDADDFLPQGVLQKLLDDAQKSGAEIVIGKTAKCLTSREIIVQPRTEISREEKSLWSARKYGMGTPWGKLYKASLWERTQFFEGYGFEDSIVYLDIYPQCKKFYLEGSPSYCFRSGKNSLYKRQKNSAKSIDALWIVIKAVQHAQEIGVDIYNSEYYQLILWHLSTVMYGRLTQFESREILESAFVVAAEFISKTFAGKAEYAFVGDESEKEIYRLLEKSFQERDFGTWVQCSKAL